MNLLNISLSPLLGFITHLTILLGTGTNTIVASAFLLPTTNTALRGSPLKAVTTDSNTNKATRNENEELSHLDLQDNTKKRAYVQQTPHSGRHFLPSHPSIDKKSSSKSILRFPRRIINRFRRPAKRSMQKRFFEGWYYRITLPEDNVSFAFIFSIEDPGRRDSDEFALSCVQVMGPDDEYLVQADRDDTKFWAWEGSQALGCTFEWVDQEGGNEEEQVRNKETTVMAPDEWKKRVKSGFQMLPTRLLGRVNGHDGSLGGVHDGEGIPGTCDFDLTIEPLSGWGNDEEERGSIGKSLLSKDGKQRSTAGWLASYSVFEPHWQVTMADGRATGSASWKGKRYDFKNVPFYAEKNWGGDFPSKWYWAQCNSFDGYTSEDGSTRLAVTAGGGTRKIPFGQSEDLGMVSVHYNGVFYEAVPWTGEMDFQASSWGFWNFTARCTSGERLFEVELKAECDPIEVPGVVLRAPTRKDGMAYMCRDSFHASVTMSLYDIIWDETKKDYVRKPGPPIIDNATSKQCAVEIGGGPWWDDWKAKSKMKQPMKGLVKLPYIFRK